MLVTAIEYEGVLYAILLRPSGEDKEQRSESRVHFITRPTDPLQVALSYYKKGHLVRAHRHIDRRRMVTSTYEVLHLEQGSAKINIFNDERKLICSAQLRPGDTIILMRGYHSLKFDEDSVIIEVKQGPYLGKEYDKEYMKLGE